MPCNVCMKFISPSFVLCQYKDSAGIFLPNSYLLNLVHSQTIHHVWNMYGLFYPFQSYILNVQKQNNFTFPSQTTNMKFVISLLKLPHITLVLYTENICVHTLNKRTYAFFQYTFFLYLSDHQQPDSAVLTFILQYLY